MTALPLRRRSKRSGPVDSPAKNSDLPVTAYLVLGILAAYDEQLTAGEIKTRAEFSVGHFYWSPSVSHIRRELTKLLDRGHVTSHAAELGARSVTLFEATPEGEHALRGWVKSFPGGEQVMVKHPVILKTWLARGVSPQVMIGHSLGEFVAAALAGIFTLDDALHLIAVRGRLMS